MTAYWWWKKWHDWLDYDSNVDDMFDEQMTSNRACDEDMMLVDRILVWQKLLCMWQWWKCVETVSLNCKCKLDLHLTIGYLKPFLARSKKTWQSAEWRVGALCISRCWFYLTVVVIWCCVLLCYGSWWFKCLWYVNDEVKDVYKMIVEWWIGS